jgi:hypothetical protein
MAQKIMSSFMLLAGLLILCDFRVHAAACMPKAEADQALDLKVKSFLDNHRYSWQDMNVPEEDGQALFNLILKNQYKKALEIETSTGHSGIWKSQFPSKPWTTALYLSWIIFLSNSQNSASMARSSSTER